MGETTWSGWIFATSASLTAKGVIPSKLKPTSMYHILPLVCSNGSPANNGPPELLHAGGRPCRGSWLSPQPLGKRRLQYASE